MVRLRSGLASTEEFDACQRWRQASPEHERAWSRLDAVNQQIKALPGELAHATFDRAAAARRRVGRRAMLKSVVLVGGVGALGLVARQPARRFWHGATAAHRTATGEQQLLALADGGSVRLNTATALDLRLAETPACIDLWQGEVLVQCVRELAVRTAHGLIRAQGGSRFSVRQMDDGRSTQVQVLDGQVRARAEGQAQAVLVRQGEQWRFGADQRPVQPANADAVSWVDGVLVARQMRLADFVAELGRYRAGWLRCAEDAMELRLSGVFPLADPERVLAAIERTLPVRSRRVSRYWMTLQRL